jgi:enoyl-CoA hydratase
MGTIDLALAADGIATLQIQRPEALNSLSSAVLDEMDRALDRVESDDAIRGLIVTGGGRAFVSGADIEEISRLDAQSGLEFARKGQRVFTRIENLPKPVIAAVNGFALGGGCELAMACHIRIASSSARFGQPEVKLGILPGFGGTQRLPRLVGRGIAAEVILSGRMLRAEEALQIGLVNKVVEPDVLLDEARATLVTILKNGPRALAASLAALRDGLDRPLEEALELEARLFASVCGTPEMHEGTSAFLSKRPPQFRS